jgi:MOSC domain-containing protein YiiM
VDGTAPETCAECGFDSRRWRVRDAGSFLNLLGYWWRLATDGIPAEQLNSRPALGVWSALEYGGHSAVVTAMVRWGIEQVVEQDGVELPVLPDDASGRDVAVTPAATSRPEQVVGDLEREGQALGALAAGAPKDAWTHTGRLPDGGAVQAEAALLHAVHDASHHQMDVGRGLAALGAGTPAHTGAVARVNASHGGVPKHAISNAEVTTVGLVGDRQADRRHHGRPFQALCVWSAAVIDELAAAGHPIGAGSAGENLTLSGVDWPSLRPGTRLRIGTVLAEVSFPAMPCAKQTRWFSDGDFSRIAYERNPAWTRWYAWVREPGRVAAGDPVGVQS